MTDEAPQAHAIGDVIAAQIRMQRRAKEWSVKRLAEECARLGAPQLTMASLGNIERGQVPAAKRPRRRVLVEELVVLAAALDVPPLALFVPMDGCGLAVTDKLTMTASEALDWVAPGALQPRRCLLPGHAVTTPATAPEGSRTSPATGS